MARVKMDLAELKQLEQKIEILEKEKQDLIDKQHQVVVHHKYFNGKIKPSNKHSSPYINIQGVYNQSYGVRSYFNEQFNLTDALNMGYVEIDLTEDSSRHTKDYINMSEAISQIREEEKEKLLTQIETSSQRAINAELQLETLSTDHVKDIERLKKQHLQKLEKIQEEHEETLKLLINEKDEEIQKLKEGYKKLSEEFEDFKSNKKRISLEEELASLKNELENYKNKSFWKRVLNK